MRFDSVLVGITLLGSAAAAAIHGADISPRIAFEIEVIEPRDDGHELYKRRGGGGHSGGGSEGGGSGSEGSGSGSEGGGSGEEGGGSSSSGGTKGSGSSGEEGSTSPYPGYTGYSGHGPAPSYGGGGYYAGGSRVPFTAGRVSPGAGISPFLYSGRGLVFWPGVWPYGLYAYPYHEPYTFYNVTTANNQTVPVICGCARFGDCGCDEVNNTDALHTLIGNGSYFALNKSIINVAEVNGTHTILLNSTLPNGTAAAASNDGGSMRNYAEALGYWPLCAAVFAAVYMV